MTKKISFEAYGPFFLDGLTDEWKNDFITQVEMRRKGLSKAIGCYAFGIKHGSSLTPEYVGKTKRSCFKDEAFADGKLKKYSQVVHPERGKPRKGEPFMMLFPLMTPTKREFSKNKLPAIEWLEKTLITMALLSNPELQNKSDTKYPRIVYVRGILGDQPQGQPTEEAKAAKKIFGL